jgi:hypothetical protein
MRQSIEPGARITQIKEFTPAAWAKARAREKVLAQAAGASKGLESGKRPSMG